MPVDTKHPDYNKNYERWKKCRKVMDSDAIEYIYDIDPTDKKRSDKYKSDAILTNFTARTVNGLVGMVMVKDPTYKLPPAISYMEEDCTDDNLSLAQAGKQSLEETLAMGRYGIMADYPAVDPDLTAREKDMLELKARLYMYETESLINWAESIINGRKVTSMVHIHDKFDSLGADGFQWVQGERYINLRLEDGIYVQTIYGADKIEKSRTIPIKADGQPFKELPFSFIGSRKNKPKPDPSPIYDLVCLNIGHYRNSASYEESVVVCGQPSLFITTAMTQDQFKQANPKGIFIGSRKGHNLGATGSAFLLQAQPNTLAKDAMLTKEQQAVMLGAKLITPQASNETAEAARIRNASEVSVLDAVATNVSEAIRKGLKWCAEFMGGNPEEVEFELNYDFYPKGKDPQMIMAEIQLFDRGVIGITDLRNTARETGMINPNRTDEMIEAENAGMSPFMMGGTPATPTPPDPENTPPENNNNETGQAA